MIKAMKKWVLTPLAWLIKMFLLLISLIVAGFIVFFTLRGDFDVRGLIISTILGLLALALLFPKLRDRIIGYWVSDEGNHVTTVEPVVELQEPKGRVWLRRGTMQRCIYFSFYASFATIILWFGYLAAGGGEVWGIDLRMWAMDRPLRWPTLVLSAITLALNRIAYGIPIGNPQARMFPEILIYAPRCLTDVGVVILRILAEFAMLCVLYLAPLMMIFEITAFM